MKRKLEEGKKKDARKDVKDKGQLQKLIKRKTLKVGKGRREKGGLEERGNGYKSIQERKEEKTMKRSR